MATVPETGTKVRTAKFMGWRPDLPDIRDFKYGDLLRAVDRVEANVPLLPTRAYAKGISKHPVFDQGPFGSCTGQSSAVMHALASKLSPRSALFIYAEARKMIGELDRDEGAYIRDAVKVLATAGSPRDDLWPDVPGNVFKDPVEVADKDAARRRIYTYYRLEGRADYQTCLAAGYGFVIGVTVYGPSFYAAGTRGGVVPFPAVGERPQGGHAIFVWGYDNDFRNSEIGKSLIAKGIDVPERVYMFRNSWGVGWGDGGNGYLDARIVENRDLSDDAWTIRKKAQNPVA